MKELCKKDNITYSFASPLAEYITKRSPHIRGISQVCSFLLRLIPFLDTKVFLRLRRTECILDLIYRTHFAFLMSPFELLESYMVLYLLNERDVFFDIGSNWGYFAFLGSAVVGENGKVIAVEANCKTFRRLQQTVVASGLSNVLTFNLAMSSSSGDKVSVFLPWYKVDTAGFMKANGQKFDVSTKTLDLLWGQLGSPKVKMIKIDTEGAEPLILEGGKRFFAEGLEGVALIEIGSWSKERFGCDPMQVYRKMREFGFHHIYRADRNKIVSINPPKNETECFLGNVFFAKTKLSEPIEKCMKLIQEHEHCVK